MGQVPTAIPGRKGREFSGTPIPRYPVIAGGFTGHDLTAVVENPVFQQEEVGLSTAEPAFCRGTVQIDDGSDNKRLVNVQPTGFSFHTSRSSQYSPDHDTTCQVD